MKKAVWLGNSRSQIKNFPGQAQDLAGYELFKVQNGMMPSDWRPMPNIGAGAIEIRIHHPYEHRVFYVAKFPEAIYVLHCFAKKTNQTALKDIRTGRREYAELEKRRQKTKE
jgi:phage-related protein